MADETDIKLDNRAAHELLQILDAPIVILDLDGKIAHFNRACERLTGYEAAEALGRDIFALLIAKDEADAVRGVFAKLREGNAPSRFRNLWRTKSGEQRLLEWSNTVLRDTQGRPAYIVGAGVDVTEIEQRQRELSDSRRFLRSIIDASPIALITIDAQGAILAFSKQAEAVFGYSEADMLGKNVSLLMPEPDRSHHNGYLRRYLETREAKIIGKPRKVTALRRNGERFSAMLHVTMFEDDRNIFVGFVEDITEIEQAQRHLAETERLLQHANRVGAMGEMATSIAHELNQPLTAAASLIGAVALALKKSKGKENQDSGHLLHDAIGEIQRASAIIRQMRDFVRQRETAKSLHKVNKVVGEAAAIATIGTAGDSVKIETDFAPNVGEAMIDRIQIQQVITNLVRNAAEAMHSNGSKRIMIATEKKDGMIEIRVEDNGCGIPPEMKDQLFEPFASTKPEGLGVGLSIAKAIIDAHQGGILAADNAEGGSTFIVRLPSAQYGKDSEESEGSRSSDRR
ncbi:MAG: PAS domain S-box protein [Amphiplicatus sp.]